MPGAPATGDDTVIAKAREAFTSGLHLVTSLGAAITLRLCVLVVAARGPIAASHRQARHTGPAWVAVSRSFVPSRTGVPFAPVTGRTPRGPSWSNAPALTSATSPSASMRRSRRHASTRLSRRSSRSYLARASQRPRSRTSPLRYAPGDGHLQWSSTYFSTPTLSTRALGSRRRTRAHLAVVAPPARRGLSISTRLATSGRRPHCRHGGLSMRWALRRDQRRVAARPGSTPALLPQRSTRSARISSREACSRPSSWRPRRSGPQSAARWSGSRSGRRCL